MFKKEFEKQLYRWSPWLVIGVLGLLALSCNAPTASATAIATEGQKIYQIPIAESLDSRGYVFGTETGYIQITRKYKDKLGVGQVEELMGKSSLCDGVIPRPPVCTTIDSLLYEWGIGDKLVKTVTESVVVMESVGSVCSSGAEACVVDTEGKPFMAVEEGIDDSPKAKTLMAHEMVHLLGANLASQKICDAKGECVVVNSESSTVCRGDVAETYDTGELNAVMLSRVQAIKRDPSCELLGYTRSQMECTGMYPQIWEDEDGKSVVEILSRGAEYFVGDEASYHKILEYWSSGEWREVYLLLQQAYDWQGLSLADSVEQMGEAQEKMLAPYGFGGPMTVDEEQSLLCK